MVDANVAMLIDYENVGLGAIDNLLDELSDVGRVIIRRAYADWSVQRGKQDQLLDLGIEPIHQYHSNKSGKNSSDIRLVIEAIDLLHSSPIDTFVVVSSDSDFVPLVGRLRSAGKSVIVAGRRETTSPTLIKSCDRFIFLNESEPAIAQNAVSRRRAPARRGTQAAARTPTPDPKSLLLRAMNASMDEEGSVVGSKLYQTMRRIEPSFDYKDLRHRIFTQFLDSYSDVVDVIRPKDGSGDVIVQIHGNREQPRTATRRNGRGRQNAAEPADQPTAPRPDADHRSAGRRRTPLRYQPDDVPAPAIQRNPPQPAPQPVILPPVPPADIESEVAKAADAAEAKKEAEASVVPAIKDVSEEAQAQAPQQQDDAPAAASDPVQAATWAEEVNAAWHKRDKDRIAGRVAAMDAAKALGARKLSVSEYPSLEKLLEASTLLQLNWRRDGNAIIRK